MSGIFNREKYNGQRYRFGRWDSPEAKEAYKRFRITLLEGEVPVQGQKKGRESVPIFVTAVTVAELVEQFFIYLDRKGVTDKRDRPHWKRTLGFLAESCGDLPVDRFTRKFLIAVRDRMIKAKTLCRDMINRYIRLVVRVFDWGVDMEIVPEEIVGSISRIGAFAD